MQQDLTEYIAQELRDIHPFFQWKVQNNSIRKTVELYASFRVGTDVDLPGIQDQFGNSLTTDYLQFEDVIAFYDPDQSDLLATNYLGVIPFDNSLGIDRGEVDVVIKHFIRVLSSGKTELEDFIQDPDQDEFMIKWDQHNLNQALDTAKELRRYAGDKLFMNFEENVSIIKEFTEGNNNDGVERV